MAVRQNIILIVACTAVLFEAMDIAIINLAMPLIQTQFGLDNNQVLWLQALYVLPYGGFLVIGGKLSDLLGRKKIFMIGSLLFLFTSLGAGLSTNFELLALFRCIQGLAAALVLPAALSIITNTFTESTARSKAVSIFSAFAAVGSGLGLSLGGIIATYAGWQWAFFINVPTIGISLVLGYLYIGSDPKMRTTHSPDVVSAFLLTAIILTLSYLAHDFIQIKKQIALFTALFMFTVIAIRLFIYRSNRSANPLIDFTLFRNKTTLIANAGTLMMGAFFSGYLFIISLIFQNDMHYSAAKAGLLLFPFSLLSALTGKFLFPQLLRRLSIPRIAILGMTLMMTGGLILIASILLDYYLPMVLFSVACVTGIGMAILFPSLTVMAVNEIPSAQHGLASSVSSTSYFFGGGFGLSLLGLFMQISGSARHVSILPVVMLSIYACIGVLLLLSFRSLKLSEIR